MYLKLHIEGTRPLMVHAPTLADPTLEITRQYKELTKKRDKTEQDYYEISKLEFRAGLYMDAKTGPGLPGRNLKAALQHAGKRTKKGKMVREAIAVMESHVPLLYKGARDVESLWDTKKKTADGEQRSFVHLEQLKVDQKRITRTRPIFREWEMKAHLFLDQIQLDAPVLKSILETSGFYCGIGECRPDYGRFKIISFAEVSEAEALAAMG